MEKKLTRWLLMLSIIFILVFVGEFAFVHTRRHRVAEPMAKVEPVENPQIQISDEFREVAGDAFDKVLALQAAELKGKLFYEPILHEADLAVIKAHRKASNDAETRLAVEIDFVKGETELYRGAMEVLNTCGTNNCTSEERRPYLALVQKYKTEQEDFGEAISESLKKP